MGRDWGRAVTGDRFDAARAVADAVLYEGYVLYPYRASAGKNQMRWQFGVLVPRAFSESDGFERSASRTECLIDPGKEPRLSVRLRCLHVQHRAVEAAGPGPGGFAPVSKLEVDGRVYVAWDEAVDRTVDLPILSLPAGRETTYEERFSLDSYAEFETVRRLDGGVAGRLIRTRQAVEGRVQVRSSPATGDYRKVIVTVENTTGWTGGGKRRDEVIGQSLVAAHTMLAVDGGKFVSALDPPEGAQPAAAGCHNDGVFPVLIGPDDDVVLSSPIILYDHPEVAPESPGDLYDATEIDEILALRVLTLTEEEKSEARGTDPRAAAIIDRCDDMPAEVWERLHGAIRSLNSSVPAPERVPWWDPSADAEVDPWSDTVMIAGVVVGKGCPVRLHPSRRADAQDLFLRGLLATVAGVFRNVDGEEQIAVSLDGDPAAAEFSWQGRYLFFFPDEIEPLDRSGVP